ncbi:unnamed protein product [Paramecium sonneborni]|uniref:WD40-repeat-containing domain n=1 Tax=Paramecium sonneborni TaxID=65129 RepID=A0A8S1PFL0_9CILI|nr:unnamed protein product [Paramecium sonneborni]
MNTKDIEKKNYIKALIQVKREIKKQKQQQDSKSEVKDSSSLSLYDFKNQQQLEDQQSISNFGQPNSKVQQQNSNITSISNDNFFENLEQTQHNLYQLIQQLYQIKADDLDKIIKNKEEVYICEIKKEQQEICQDLSFNKDDTLLATANGKNIKIQQFNEGNLSQITILQGHVKNISCILFSKKTNSIFSGGYIDDHLICLWEEKIQNNWELTVQKDSRSPITCMELNQQETKLIVGNQYGFVQIWEIDYKKKIISIHDEQRKIHKKVVYGVSLNKSETQLVTCSGDSKIIVWKICEQGMLEVLRELIEDTFVSRIRFLDNHRFVVSQSQRGLIEFKISSLEITKKTIVQTDYEDCHYFPIQYHKDSQLMVVKHYRSVYLIKEFNHGDYNCIKKLNFDSNKILGALSNNGKHLIIQNENKFYYYQLF